MVFRYLRYSIQDFRLGKIRLANSSHHVFGRHLRIIDGVIVQNTLHIDRMVGAHQQMVVAEVVQGDVHGDAGEPVAEVFEAPQGVGLLHSLQERVVRQVLRHRAVGDIAIADPDQSGDVPPVGSGPKGCRCVHRHFSVFAFGCKDSKTAHYSRPVSDG